MFWSAEMQACFVCFNVRENRLEIILAFIFFSKGTYHTRKCLLCRFDISSIRKNCF